MSEINLSNVSIFPGVDVAGLRAHTPMVSRGAELGFLVALQRSLEPEEVIETFASRVMESHDVGGVEYRLPEANLNLVIGKRGRSKLVYRLAVEEVRLGEVVFSRREKFSDQEISQIEDALTWLVYPLRNAVCYQDAVRSACRDPLTGLNNRLTLESSLRRELELARRHGDSFSLLVVDMDGFKDINDQHGHASGDRALTHVAQLLEANVRNTDLLFRYAGDEFVIGLSKTDLSGAQLLANRVLESVNQSQFMVDGRALPLRLSIGGAVMEKADSLDTLFARADSALYHAKNRGRNTISFAEYAD